MKSKDFHKTIRPELKRWAKERGFKRVSSSPPAFRLEDTVGSPLSLWIQSSSGGFDPLVGGRFTINVKIGAEIGIHDSLTLRLPSTWDAHMTRCALELDASVRAKRHWPSGTHPFESFMERAQIHAHYYTPLPTLPIDYWMPYLDADDIERWSTIIGESLDQAMSQLISKGRLHGVLVPDVWPPTGH